MARTNYTDTLLSLRRLAENVKPEGGKILLFGSQARGDANANSDWDILILLDKDKIEVADHDKYTYPFWELGWELNAMFHPILYTLKDWENSKSLFHDKVETDGMPLC